MMATEISDKQIADYKRDGAVLLKAVFRDQVEQLRAGVAENMLNPGPYAAENVSPGEQGRFFDDYCNWTRIEAFDAFVRESAAAEIAAKLMQSETAQMFHEHVLVKEPGTAKNTPWHQDSPYYFVDGEQTLSFWCPLDSVNEASLRCVAGSHQWPRPVLPTRWLNEDNFYPNEEDYMPVPDPDLEGMPILQWSLEPGDAVAFHFRTLHGANGNHSETTRRAFSLRLLGDDARYIERPGRTSPPFPDHGMSAGQRLREDWFPVVFGK